MARSKSSRRLAATTTSHATSTSWSYSESTPIRDEPVFEHQGRLQSGRSVEARQVYDLRGVPIWHREGVAAWASRCARAYSTAGRFRWQIRTNQVHWAEEHRCPLSSRGSWLFIINLIWPLECCERWLRHWRRRPSEHRQLVIALEASRRSASSPYIPARDRSRAHLLQRFMISTHTGGHSI